MWSSKGERLAERGNTCRHMREKMESNGKEHGIKFTKEVVKQGEMGPDYLLWGEHLLDHGWYGGVDHQGGEGYTPMGRWRGMDC